MAEPNIRQSVTSNSSIFYYDSFFFAWERDTSCQLSIDSDTFFFHFQWHSQSWGKGEGHVRVFSTLRLWCGMCILDMTTSMHQILLPRQVFILWNSCCLFSIYRHINTHSVTGSVGKPLGHCACAEWNFPMSPAVHSQMVRNAPIVDRPRILSANHWWMVCFVWFFHHSKIQLPHSSRTIQKTIQPRYARVISLKLAFEIGPVEPTGISLSVVSIIDRWTLK